MESKNDNLEMEKLAKLGFNIEFVSKEDLDDLKKCFISISETEEITSRNYNDIINNKLKKEKEMNTSISSQEINFENLYINKNHDTYRNQDLISKNENNNTNINKHTRNPSANKKTFKEKLVLDSNIKRNQNKNINSEKDSGFNRNKLDTKDFNKEYINQLEELRRENYIMQTKIIDLEEKLSISNLEKEKNNTVYRSNNEILNIMNKEQKLELDKLREINQIHEGKLNDIIPKLEKYHDILNEKNKLILENEKLNEIISKLTSTNQYITKENETNNSKIKSISHENENLMKDKMYLSKDNLIKDEKISLLSETISVQKSEIEELKQLNKSYLAKISDVNREMDKSYYEKYKNEINELKLNHNNEIENLKKFYEEISNTKINILNEERNDLKVKVNSLELSLKDKNCNIEFLNDEFRNLKYSSQEETNFLKMKMKIKEDEIERLKRMNVEYLDQIKLIKSENDAYKEKNDMIRLELVNKECMFKEENVNLKAEVALLRESKQQYDKIENELDKFVVDSSVCEK